MGFSPSPPHLRVAQRNVRKNPEEPFSSEKPGPRKGKHHFCSHFTDASHCKNRRPAARLAWLPRGIWAHNWPCLSQSTAATTCPCMPFFLTHRMHTDSSPKAVTQDPTRSPYQGQVQASRQGLSFLICGCGLRVHSQHPPGEGKDGEQGRPYPVGRLGGPGPTLGDILLCLPPSTKVKPLLSDKGPKGYSVA